MGKQPTFGLWAAPSSKWPQGNRPFMNWENRKQQCSRSHFVCLNTLKNKWVKLPAFACVHASAFSQKARSLSEHRLRACHSSR